MRDTTSTGIRTSLFRSGCPDTARFPQGLPVRLPRSPVGSNSVRYPALIDGKDGAYGVVFPDLPGCLAMGYTIDDALLDAEKAIRQWMDAAEERGIPIPDPSLLEDVEVPEGSALTSVLLVRTPRNRPSVRVNLVLDADIADTIISEAKRRGMTRKAYVEHLVRLAAQVGA